MDEIESGNSFLYVFDRRHDGKSGPEKVYIDESYSFPDFVEEVCTKFPVEEEEDFVICTTGRNPLKEENFEKLVQPGDSVYLLRTITQPLQAPVSEKIEFQPHYDTLIKSGMYEYYASEGHANPLPFAFAELIDNALAATRNNDGPRIINLSIHYDEHSNNHCVCVYDNGKGMNSRQLNNWAIYRLSKFNRQERDTTSKESSDRTKLLRSNGDADPNVIPKSLNSDISWFGVGGKQAVFFIGSSTRVITKTKHSCDVHEFTMSMADFIRKELKKEAIFSGYIRNRKTTDCSHIENWEKVTKRLIQNEQDDESFTRIIVTDIKPEHLLYMKSGFDGWTKQLAHIYHYYIHGPEGNTVMSRERKNVGALDVQIHVNWFEQGKIKKSVELGKIDDDLESRYIRSSMDTFEFVYIGSDKVSKCEGVIRYHPFLYDKETNPTLSIDTSEMDDGNELAQPVRNTRSLIECFWNGRLIPYTFIEGFEWCRPAKKMYTIPAECYMRITGCLFTNDKFQVSTNKLTFIDLDARLRDPRGVFYRTILGMTQRTPSIQRSFSEWLRDCHEKYDKQIKFLEYEKTKTKSIGGGKPTMYSVYRAIEWDGRVFNKGEMIRTQRTNPIISGTIKNFLLCGDLKGDVYAVGGEIELIQEPSKIYGGVKTYPITKIDRTSTSEDVTKIIQEEENRLPARIRVEWPEGNEIVDGFISNSQVAIGAMKLTILNRRNEKIDKLPAAAGHRRKLHMKQQLFFIDPKTRKKVSITSHTTQHGKQWPYWFKRIDAAKDSGQYEIHLQVILGDNGSPNLQDERLPFHVIRFTVETSSVPTKFAMGLLPSTLRIGVPFDFPLTLQNSDNTPARWPSGNKPKPLINARQLKLSYLKAKVDGDQVILKNVLAEGAVHSLQGKDFQTTIRLPGIKGFAEMQTLRIRLFPGLPTRIALAAFGEETYEYKTKDKDKTMENKVLRVENGSEMRMKIVCLDYMDNVTCEDKLVAVCKMTGLPSLPSIHCDLSQTGSGILSHRFQIKKKGGKDKKKDDKDKTYPIKMVIKMHDRKSIPPLELDLIVEPSTQIQSLDVFYPDPTSGGKQVKIKKGHDLFCEAGALLRGLTFVIYDEAKRQVEVDHTCAMRMKVNWVADAATNLYELGQLPDCPVPTSVSETKFCQVSLSGSNRSIAVSFNLKATPAMPNSMRVTHSVKEVRLGVFTTDPIYVNLQDSYGNVLEVNQRHIPLLKVTGESLDDTQIKMTIQGNRIAIENLQFNEGPLGTRAVTIRYQDIFEERFMLQLCAGTPVTVGLADGSQVAEGDNFVQILSGDRMSEPIKVQLFDGWGNPCNMKGISVLLGKDHGIKLTPAAPTVKTNAEGIASFPLLTVTAKCGTYYVQPRALFERVYIEGPKLAFSVLPNNERAVKIQVSPSEQFSIQAGSACLPEFTVDLLSEEGSNITSPAHVCMVYWTGGARKDIPGHATWRHAFSENGHLMFGNVEPPRIACHYSIIFCTVASKTSKSPTLISDRVVLQVTPGIPTHLVPEEDPGTPTVSNSTQTANRTIIKCMKLRLKDANGNNTYFRNDDGTRRSGYIEVTIQPPKTNLKSDTVPQFESKTSSLRLPMTSDGVATIQNVILSENSPGADGSEYILHCEISSSGSDNPLTSVGRISPYMLKFIFCNDAKKQAEITKLLAKRDNIIRGCEKYKNAINISDQLKSQLNNNLKEQRERKKEVLAVLGITKTINKMEVRKLTSESQRKLESISTRSTRQCKLQDYNEKDVLGKIGHLAKIKDENDARLISWTMAGDMDCIVTRTTEKAQELNRTFQGYQQVLPLDTVRKQRGQWDKPLPRVDRTPTGNPRYARGLLIIDKHKNEVQEVFKMLLGDTIVMDDLESANAYRKLVIKHAPCPTILTLDGNRVRSTGKFGGKQNLCPPIERLNAVFGEPQSEDYAKEENRLEKLKELFQIMTEEERTIEEMEDGFPQETVDKNKSEFEEMKASLRKCDAQLANLRQNLSHDTSTSSEAKKRASNGPPDDLRGSPRKRAKRL